MTKPSQVFYGARVLVTGGAGFIGSHLVEALVRHGLKVSLIDDLSGGKIENLSSVINRVEFYRDDIRNRPLVEKLVQGVTVVFHLAGISSVPQSQIDPSLCLDVNGQGTLNVLELAAKAGVKRLVYASTSAVYGDLPAPHDEELRPSPDSPYAAVKLLGEHLGHHFRESMNLTTISLRLFNAYGPRQSPDGPDAGVIPIFLRALKNGEPPIVYGDGLQTRDFIHVSDVVRALLHAAIVSEPMETVFNVATGRSDTILSLLEIMREDFPNTPPAVHLPARSGDPVISVASVDKARDILGFQAKVGLREGLKGLADHF
ncbi:MAG: NAD-dependent epimerase/dehydratase family protein [Deltaproteobacteria bacterium]|nr:NAD-dependent epimerase/dehydratase family protein [Deltaproteobacteria bacterium]